MVNLTYQLRQIKPQDNSVLREVYADAIKSQAFLLYSKKQVDAWSSLAWVPGVLDRPLSEGKGWLSFNEEGIEAFALRFPHDRLALLYCRGRSARRGHATALLKKLELDAIEELSLIHI